MPRPPSTLPQVPEVKNFWVFPGRVVAALRRKHGDIFSMARPRGTIICATGLEANKAFLVDHADKVTNGAGWDYVAPAIAEIGRGIVFMDGPDQRWFRRVMQPGFSPSAVAAYVPLMHEIARARLAGWPRHGAVELYNEVNAITFDITAAIILGVRDDAKLRELNGLFRQVTLREPLPESPAQMQRLLATALLPLIRARREQPEGDVLSRLIRAGVAEGRVLSDDDILTQVNTLMVAGHFTAAGLCSYLLLGLYNNPYLPRLREELLTQDDPDMDAIGRMTLLEHAVLEAERFVSPVPHLPRGIATEMEFQGHVLPQGALLLCSVAGTHMDDSIFPNPETGDPDRFAPPRNEQRRDPVALAAFGAGPRRCIGAVLARVMIKTIVHHVVRDFVLEPTKEAYVPSFSMPIIRPSNGMPVKVQALRA